MCFGVELVYRQLVRNWSLFVIMIYSYKLDKKNTQSYEHFRINPVSFYNIGVGKFFLSNRYPLVIPQYEAVDSMKVEQGIPIVPCEHELYSMSDWCIWSSGSTRSRMWPFKIDVLAGSSVRPNGKKTFFKKGIRLNGKIN